MSVRPFVPGAGAGPPTGTVSDDRRMSRSRSARPLNAPGSGLSSRQAHPRSLAPWRSACRAWVPG